MVVYLYQACGSIVWAVLEAPAFTLIGPSSSCKYIPTLSWAAILKGLASSLGVLNIQWACQQKLIRLNGFLQYVSSSPWQTAPSSRVPGNVSGSGNGAKRPTPSTSSPSSAEGHGSLWEKQHAVRPEMQACRILQWGFHELEALFCGVLVRSLW